jgi:hypothetical protein
LLTIFLCSSYAARAAFNVAKCMLLIKKLKRTAFHLLVEPVGALFNVFLVERLCRSVKDINKQLAKYGEDQKAKYQGYYPPLQAFENKPDNK